MTKGKYNRTLEHRKNISLSLIGYKHSGETKRKISNSLKGRKFTEEHRKKISATKQGISVEQWKNFSTTKLKILRNSVDYEIWRRVVFLRDNFTCQNCNKRGGILHAHHIKSFAKYPHLRFDINNGRTLCYNCHIKTYTLGVG